MYRKKRLVWIKSLNIAAVLWPRVKKKKKRKNRANEITTAANREKKT